MRQFSLHCDVCTGQAGAEPKGWIAFREVGLRLILIPFEQPEVEMDPQMGCVCGLECLGRLVFGWGSRAQANTIQECALQRFNSSQGEFVGVSSSYPSFHLNGTPVTPAEAEEWLEQGVVPDVDPIHELGRLERPETDW